MPEGKFKSNANNVIEKNCWPLGIWHHQDSREYGYVARYSLIYGRWGYWHEGRKWLWQKG